MTSPTPGPGPLREYLSGIMDESMEHLRAMMGINSFTENSAGVERLGKYTARAFARLGFTHERVTSSNPRFGRHLVLNRPGKGGSKLLLLSHLDTVFTEEEERANGFAWRIEGDRVYGPGANDIKGGTVVMYMTLSALAHFAPDEFDRARWTIILNASEEVDSDDFAGLCLSRAGDADACLVFESGTDENTDNYLVVSRKGRAVFRVDTAGRGAHSGAAHERGASAVTQLASVVLALEALTDHGRELTVNTGVVSGGTVVNRVPHAATALVEMRAFDPGVFRTAKGDILALERMPAVASADGRFRCSTRVSLEREVPPWPENAGSRALFGHWENAANAMGIRALVERRGGLSDGNYLWDAMPVIDGLGPSGDNCHCSVRSGDGTLDQEYANIPSFVTRSALNTLAILSILRKGVGGR